MRIIYVTACMPYSMSETFIIGEIAQLLHDNEVMVVPRSPGKLGTHAEWLVPFTRCERLQSPRVWCEALRLMATMPRRVFTAARLLFRGRRLGVNVRNLAVFPKALWLAATATDWHADHIHCHWAGTTATMAMIASELSGIPWSLTTHRSDIVSDNLLADKGRSATMIRAISLDGRNSLIARGVEPGNKLRVLPMGVHVPAPVLRDRPAADIFLCPADLLEVKGHRFLLEAWKLLRDRGLKARLWLAGSGELESSLKALVVKLGLVESVVFLGTMKHEDLLDLYRTNKILGVVLASIDLGGGCHEGIPVALVEAMSYGVPVISTTTGGIPELVQPGTGLLVAPEEPAALAAAVEKIVQDTVFALTLGESGRRRVAETRDIVRITAELEKVFAASRPLQPEACHQSITTDWLAGATEAKSRGMDRNHTGSPIV